MNHRTKHHSYTTENRILRYFIYLYHGIMGEFHCLIEFDDEQCKYMNINKIENIHTYVHTYKAFNTFFVVTHFDLLEIFFLVIFAQSQ